MTKSDRKIPSYRQKFGDTKPYYGFRKCEHNGTHTEKSEGGPYKVCNACNTIVENLNPRSRAMVPVLRAA